MTRCYVVTYRTEQADVRIDRVFVDIEEAKARVLELEGLLTHYTNSDVGIVSADLIRPREWTPEQRRWMRGAK